MSGLSRGLRHSQSLIRKSPVSCVLPGDDSSVKLQTLRPIISNIEHVGKYFVLYRAVFWCDLERHFVDKNDDADDDDYGVILKFIQSSTNSVLVTVGIWNQIKK